MWPPASPVSRFARFLAGIARRLRVASWAVSGRQSTLGASCGWTTIPRSPCILRRLASQPRDAPNVLHRLRRTTTASPTVASTSRPSFTSRSSVRRSSTVGCSTSCRTRRRWRRYSRSSCTVAGLRKATTGDARGTPASEGRVGVLPLVCETAQGAYPVPLAERPDLADRRGSLQLLFTVQRESGFAECPLLADSGHCISPAEVDSDWGTFGGIDAVGPSGNQDASM